MKSLLLGSFVAIAVHLTHASLLGNETMAEERVRRDSHITVVLKVVSTAEISKMFRGDDGGYSRGLYLLGEVKNHYSTSVLARIRVWSPNNPAISVKEISVGWVPPNGHTPVYFMRYLMQPPLKASIEDVALEYDLLSVDHK